ncbi:Homeodomain-like protein [Lactarius tabidus]
MVRRHISTELKESALSMSFDGMSDAEIRKITGISERSLKRLRSVYRKTGGVVPPPPIESGRPRVLTAIHVKYLCDCVERRRDVPLSELRAELREVFDVTVSVQTIARSLQRVGVCKENSRPSR